MSEDSHELAPLATNAINPGGEEGGNVNTSIFLLSHAIVLNTFLSITCQKQMMNLNFNYRKYYIEMLMYLYMACRTGFD